MSTQASPCTDGAHTEGILERETAARARPEVVGMGTAQELSIFGIGCSL